jgi:argininosuccinate synthase
MPRYAELIYNGFWFSPEREALQALIDKTQEHVTGTVRVKLYKGSARTVARWSDYSLYSEKHVTFEEDAGAYDQKDAGGFIKLNALRMRIGANRDARKAAKVSAKKPAAKKPTAKKAPAKAASRKKA